MGATASGRVWQICSIGSVVVLVLVTGTFPEGIQLNCLDGHLPR